MKSTRNLIAGAFATFAVVFLPLVAKGDATTPQCGLTTCELDASSKQLLDSEGYKLVTVPSDGIETVLTPGSSANGIPETVQGIWWITVNPLAYILVSLGGETRWDPVTRTAYCKLYGAKTSSFHHTTAGQNLFVSFLRQHMGFLFKFSDDDKFVTITPTMELFGQQVAIPEAVLKYDMRLVEDGHFVRESWLFGQRLPDYQLRRIVRADGSRDADYSAYLLDADAQSFVAEKK